jgi:hypothetical protein
VREQSDFVVAQDAALGLSDPACEAKKIRFRPTASVNTLSPGRRKLRPFKKAILPTTLLLVSAQKLASKAFSGIVLTLL